MVTVQELEALELMLWLRNGNLVASLVGVNQSSISRRCHRALARFQARLRREPHCWSVDTSIPVVLDLERRLHQQLRLHLQQRLRLNVPHWTQPLLRGCSLPGWICNPEDGPLVCDNPLALLRDRVIDACLLTPTQIGSSQDDLLFFELYHTEIDLYEIASPPAADSPGLPSQMLDILSQGQLRLVEFLPTTCRRSSLERFRALCAQFDLPEASSFTDSSQLRSLAFLTPPMAGRLQSPRWLPLEIAWPYRESLAVLRSNAEEPAVQQLLECLRSSLPAAVQQQAAAGGRR